MSHWSSLARRLPISSRQVLGALIHRQLRRRRAAAVECTGGTSGWYSRNCAKTPAYRSGSWQNSSACRRSVGSWRRLPRQARLEKLAGIIDRSDHKVDRPESANAPRGREGHLVLAGSPPTVIAWR